MRIKQYCVLLGVLLQIGICQLSAQPPQYIFNISPDDDAYLNYLEVQNKFEYSAVKYKFGEIWVTSATANFRVNLKPWTSTAASIQGTGAQGESTDLLEYTASEPFNLPNEEPATVHFYRRVSKWAPSNAFPELPTDPPGTPGRDPWDMDDQTEWVVEVRLASTGETIAELDKVGVNAHDKIYTPAYYGTDPLNVRQTKEISTGHPGELVYIQVVPKRWGPTPYGLTVMLRPTAFVNHSAIESEFGEPLSSSATAAINDQWFNEVLNFCTVVKQSTGALPEDIRHWNFTSQQNDAFRAAFLQLVTIDGYDVWIEQNPPPTPRLLTKRIGSNAQTVRASPVYITEIAPNPIVGGSINILVDGQTEEAIEILLHTLDGREVGVLWKGNAGKGKQKFALSLPELTSGSYMLLIKGDDGRLYDTKQVNVVK